jgi:hypothetical protein
MDRSPRRMRTRQDVAMDRRRSLAAAAVARHTGRGTRRRNGLGSAAAARVFGRKAGGFTAGRLFGIHGEYR